MEVALFGGSSCSPLTEFDTVKAEKVAREDHLTKPKAGTKCGEKRNWGDTQAVDEEDREERIDESQIKDWHCQCANSE